jgi:hypothetical protein
VIAAGGFHSCALLENGTVKCWGDNFYGQLGQGDMADRGDNDGEMGDLLAPVDLGEGRTATAITAGVSHSCAVLDDGAVKCWGDNFDGRLGYGDTTRRGDNDGEMGDGLAPVDLGPGRTATAVTASLFHTCALLDGGSVKCWGNNGNGQLGQGDIVDRGDEPDEMGDVLVPVDLGVGRTALAITARDLHTCALLDDGAVKCWGDNFFGQLGQGDTTRRGDNAGEMGASLAPVDLGAERTATAITAGRSHTCALLDDGAVKCWGFNLQGQLGQGDSDDRGDEPGELGDSLTHLSLHSSLAVVPVDAAPAPPSVVSAKAGPQRATLEWSAPADDGGQPITGYRVESSTDAVTWTTAVVDTASTTTSHTVTGMAAGVAVRFRVEAINIVGASPPSMPTAAVTPTTTLHADRGGVERDGGGSGGGWVRDGVSVWAGGADGVECELSGGG